MKKLLLLGCLFCLTASLFGQNIMFLNYEKYASYDKVKGFCHEQPATDVLFEENEELMLVQLESFIFRYQFHDEQLYQITMTKEFDDYKTARVTEKGILHYFDAIGANPVENISLGNTRRYVYLRDARVMELFITYHHAKAITFELSSKFVEHTPAYALDKYTDLLAGTLISKKD
jgi:hypothetical protein